MDSNVFCSMGGMSHEMHHRRLLEAHPHHHHNEQLVHENRNNWDVMPIILPDDDQTNQQDHSGQHEQHDMQHHDHDNNHDMNDMNHDHSSHNGGMGSMSMGTVMYMDGFHSALFPSPDVSPPPCLNLFHPSWTLHTPTKFIFAMIFVSLIGVLVEACGVWRVKCLRKGRKFRREIKLKRMQAWEEHQRQLQNGHNNMQGQQLEFRRQSQRRIEHGFSDISDVSSEGNNTSSSSVPATSDPTSANPVCPAIIRRAWRTIVPKFIRTILAKLLCCGFIQQKMNRDSTMKAAKRYEAAAAFLHASRAWLGYLLMLSVMTYAIEFLLAAVLGMVLGRYWFVDMEGGNSSDAPIPGGGGGVMNGAVGVGGGIGGMGMGDAGGGGASSRHQSAGQMALGMTDLHHQNDGNDGTWGGGGDPCCGIDDDDEDDHHHHHNESAMENGGLTEPLLASLVGSNNVGVTRRSAGNQ